MTEYYKGYTQHLISTGRDDIDPANVLIMNMKSGLYLMKHIGQEGYVLPVCKFINNYRSDVLGEVPVTVDGPSMHPCYDYATVIDKQIALHNLDLHPATIKGGIVVLTNIMKTMKLKRYYPLDKGNLKDLIASNDISVLNVFTNTLEDGNIAEGLIITVNKSCILQADTATYTFTLEGAEGSYTDFKAKIKYE